MEITLTDRAREDLAYWQGINNEKVLKRIRALLESVKNSPTKGIGKAERLKHDLRGHWSRRIAEEHRLVYRFDSETITVVAMRFHYK